MRAHQLRAKRGAETDWPMRENRDGVTDPDSARLGTTDAVRGDVGEKDDLLVGDVVGDPGEIRLRIRDESILRLRALRIPHVSVPAHPLPVRQLSWNDCQMGNTALID